MHQLCTPARGRTAGCNSRPPRAGPGNFDAAQLEGAAAHPPSVQACRCDALAPSPIGSIATPHTHTHVHARGRGRTAGCYSRAPPAGPGNFDAAQIKGTAAHLPSVQACRCDGRAPSPIGSIATPHMHTHVHARRRGRTAGCYSRPPPAGPGNFNVAQLKGAAPHLPSAQACRCDGRAPNPIGSIATPHTCARRPAAARRDAIAGLRRFRARPTVLNPPHRRGSRGAFKRYIAQRQRSCNGHRAVYGRCQVLGPVQQIAAGACGCALQSGGGCNKQEGGGGFNPSQHPLHKPLDTGCFFL